MWELKLTIGCWALGANWISLSLFWNPSTNITEAFEDLMPCFIYWNVFVWENLKNWRISPESGWLFISNSHLTEFAVVSGTYTRIRRDMFADVSIWFILALRSLQSDCVGWSFATTPIQFIFFSMFFFVCHVLFPENPGRAKAKSERERKTVKKSGICMSPLRSPPLTYTWVWHSWLSN